VKITHFDGIKGLTGRDPIGVALSVGRKDPERGFPTDRDKFYLVMPKEAPGGPKGKGWRPPHPAFKPFNDAGLNYVRGNIVHSSREQAANIHLSAFHVPDGPGQHPKGFPNCRGDGEKAQRWMGGEPDNFQVIDCPNDRCTYRMKENWGGTAPCKPFGQILFQLRWPEGNTLPQMLCKLNTKSWNSCSALKGFFDYIDEAARNLGLESYSLFGFPFTITLQEQKGKPTPKYPKGTKYPVLTFTPDMEPVKFFSYQREMLNQIGAPPNVRAITDQSMEEVGADHAMVDPAVPR